MNCFIKGGEKLLNVMSMFCVLCFDSRNLKNIGALQTSQQTTQTVLNQRIVNTRSFSLNCVRGFYDACKNMTV